MRFMFNFSATNNVHVQGCKAPHAQGQRVRDRLNTVEWNLMRTIEICARSTLGSVGSL